MKTGHAFSENIDAPSTSMRRRRDCRLCGSGRLRHLFSLGQTPPANAFVTAENRSQPQEHFPLDVHLCQECRHVQLLDVVDPELLFRNYVYVSSTSTVFVEHFRRYARAVLDLLHLPPGCCVIEIGSNDGTCLQFFKEAGMRVLGIDPALAIAAEATRKGIETVPEFFNLSLAQRLKAQDLQAHLVIANNVFAHADDLHTIVDGVSHLLKSDGLFVFEVSYLLDVVQKTLFDTIYHEHLSYHTVGPLIGFFERHGMKLVDVIRVDSHGGSLRGLAQPKAGPLPVHPRVQELVDLEARFGLHDAAAYQDFFNNVQKRKQQLNEVLHRFKKQGKRIAGFGAPAKATTLMYHFGLGPQSLDYILDDSPWKQGLYTPGHHIPVVPTSWLYEDARRPDAVLILAWNFAKSIMKKHQAFKNDGGCFIVPLPDVEVH